MLSNYKSLLILGTFNEVKNVNDYSNIRSAITYRKCCSAEVILLLQIRLLFEH